MKREVLTLAILAMATLGAKAQDSVFSYTHQGTTLYYIVDSTGDATVVPPLYPNVHYNADSTVVETWWGYSKPQGAVVVPDSVPFLGTNHAVTKVGNNAFRRCDSVTAITLPATVATLGLHSFRQCFRLASINIPQGVTSIGFSAFSDCIGLTSVNIPNSVTSIGEWAFSRCHSLQSVTLGEGVETIGQCAFRECGSLTSINYPSTLRVIEGFAFQYDTLLATPLNLPEGFQTIGVVAFGDCNSILSISLPGTMDSISPQVFWGCKGLQTVTLGEGIRKIGADVFHNCNHLRHIDLPSTLEEVGDQAFVWCGVLDSLFFPPNTHRLGYGALFMCESLKVLQLPEGLEKVDTLLLYSTGIETLVVPPHVTRIEFVALAGCEHLRKVQMPASVTYLGDSLFIEGTPLDTLVLGCEVPPTLGGGVFEHYNTVLIVPCGAAEAYRQHPVWGRFANIEEDCNGIEAVCGEQIAVSVRDGQIVVDGAEGETVSVYDLTGRSIATAIVVAGNDARVPVPETGVYLVKVGNLPAKKVVVIR